jgi:hypothetical protein
VTPVDPETGYGTLPGMERNRIPIKKFEINISDHISDSLIKNSYLPYILLSNQFCGSGSGLEKSRSGVRDGKIQIRDPG